MMRGQFKQFVEQGKGNSRYLTFYNGGNFIIGFNVNTTIYARQFDIFLHFLLHVQKSLKIICLDLKTSFIDRTQMKFKNLTKNKSSSYNNK